MSFLGNFGISYCKIHTTQYINFGLNHMSRMKPFPPFPTDKAFPIPHPSLGHLHQFIHLIEIVSPRGVSSTFTTFYLPQSKGFIDLTIHIALNNQPCSSERSNFVLINQRFTLLNGVIPNLHIWPIIFHLGQWLISFHLIS